MDNSDHLVHGTAEALEDQLLPIVSIAGLDEITDIDKLNELSFELYKEAWSVINLSSHLLDDEAAANGGWPRNQAICAALLVRMCKFMMVVTQLSAQGNRGEVVQALNRSILETATNLEFLVTTKEGEYFDRFVKFGLGPERELYDMIQANILNRGGEIKPIETRMLNSIEEVCRNSGIRLEDVDRKAGDWGGGIRSRLKAIGKEEHYTGTMRIHSHAVHGNWVDLYRNHLKLDEKTGLFSPRPNFNYVDERYLGPIVVLVLDAIAPYLIRYFSQVPETHLLLDRIGDLINRNIAVGNAHERLLNADEG